VIGMAASTLALEFVSRVKIRKNGGTTGTSTSLLPRQELRPERIGPNQFKIGQNPCIAQDFG
jgi:hypothetical protein